MNASFVDCHSLPSITVPPRAKGVPALRNGVEKRAFAHSETARAKRLGLMGPCAVCGRTFGIEGHHPSYETPSVIVWLCEWHHKELHGAKARTVKDGQFIRVNLTIDRIVFEKARDYVRRKPRPKESVSSLVEKLLVRELRKNGVAVPDAQ